MLLAALSLALAHTAVAAACPDSIWTAAGGGCYLVTGGLSGVGLLTAQWMVGKGARHLVVASRSGMWGGFWGVGG